MGTWYLFFKIRSNGEFKYPPNQKEDDETFYANNRIKQTPKDNGSENNLNVIFFCKSWRNGYVSFCSAKGTEKIPVFVFIFINSVF